MAFERYFVERLILKFDKSHWAHTHHTWDGASSAYLYCYIIYSESLKGYLLLITLRVEVLTLRHCNYYSKQIVGIITFLTI